MQGPARIKRKEILLSLIDTRALSYPPADIITNLIVAVVVRMPLTQSTIHFLCPHNITYRFQVQPIHSDNAR